MWMPDRKSGGVGEAKRKHSPSNANNKALWFWWSPSISDKARKPKSRDLLIMITGPLSQQQQQFCHLRTHVANKSHSYYQHTVCGWRRRGATYACKFTKFTVNGNVFIQESSLTDDDCCCYTQRVVGWEEVWSLTKNVLNERWEVNDSIRNIFKLYKKALPLCVPSVDFGRDDYMCLSLQIGHRAGRSAAWAIVGLDT